MSVKDACALLKKKGWLLSSESYSNSKLTEILFSVVLSFKLPPEADMAICLVAYIIWDQAKDELTGSLSDKLIDKITDMINEPIRKLLDSITTAKSFLDATSQQQATKPIPPQEPIKQHDNIAKSLTETSEKLNQTLTSRSLNDLAWPLLSATNPETSQAVHPASLLHSHSPASNNPQVLQHVLLTSEHLHIKYGPLEENEKLQNRLIEEQCELHQTFNDWIDNCTITPDGEEPPPPSCAVCSASIFNRPALLLEFESAASKDSFIKLCDNNSFLLKEISLKACICSCTFSIIFYFVPCQGQFDPTNSTHLHNIEQENDLAASSIVSTSWCKHQEKKISQPDYCNVKGRMS